MVFIIYNLHGHSLHQSYISCLFSLETIYNILIRKTSVDTDQCGHISVWTQISVDSKLANCKNNFRKISLVEIFNQTLMIALSDQ